MQHAREYTNKTKFRQEVVYPEAKRLYDNRDDKSTQSVIVGDGLLRDVMQFDPKYQELGVCNRSKWQLEVILCEKHPNDVAIRCVQCDPNDYPFWPGEEKLSWTNAIVKIWEQRPAKKRKRQTCANDDLARGTGQVFDVEVGDDDTHQLTPSTVQANAIPGLPWEDILNSVAPLETKYRKRDDSLIAMTVGFNHAGTITCVYIFQKQCRYDELNNYVGSYSSILVKNAFEHNSEYMRVIDIAFVEGSNRTKAEGLAYEAVVEAFGPYIVPQIPIEKLVHPLTDEQRDVCANNAKLRHLLDLEVGARIIWPQETSPSKML